MSRTPKFKIPEGMSIYPEGGVIDPKKEVIVEVGPGRGDFLFQLARENPEKQIVGIEIKPKRFARLIPRIEKQGLKNITLFLGDGRFVLKEKLKEVRASEIYILFPDPWPKKRHAKHRIFQKSFIETLSNKLAKDGSVIVATDDPKYAIEIREVFTNPGTDHVFCLPCSAGGQGDLSPKHSGAVPVGILETFYAEKWKADGRSLQFFKYIKG